MLKVDRTKKTFSPLPAPTFVDACLLERTDLQECIYNSSESFFAELGERLFVVGKEIQPSQAVSDRIDILCVDPDGAAVVVELKRGKNKLQMLQAISYAGMIARWTALDFRRLLSESDWENLTDFLEVDIEEINRRQRLLLIAEGYDFALLAGAEWLTEQFGVDIRCAGVSLATDPDVNAEYLACSSIFPPPALAEQAVARKSSTRDSRPLKWADWEEAIADIENTDVREYLKSELSNGCENYLRRRGLHYRITGKRRLSLYCRKKSGYVWQRGRFHDDEKFWQERLDDSASVKVVRRGAALSFNLHSATDLASFNAAATSALNSVIWFDGTDVQSQDVEG